MPRAIPTASLEQREFHVGAWPLITYGMNEQQPKPPQGDWTKTKLYAGVMLLAVLVCAGAQALLVPTAWKLQTAQVSPMTSPSTSPLAKQQDVCGGWLSATSQKRYNFVCQDHGFFEIYEFSDQKLNKIGSGKLTENGSVEADILVLSKNRKAYLKLWLSTDGLKMEGTWHGDDPRELGQLSFHRIL